MVRNELQLNMEVPELEFKLFDSVFIPLHKQTYPPPTMDPEPKHSVLNFHIIANIFISVFRTIEEETQTPAQHADSDEVFFSAIDKWRVGRALERREYGMIRGIHEFCDIGLEVLAWLKEDGIGQVRQRRERSDKGTKRGPRGSKKGAGTAKKGAAVGKKVNTLSARRHTKKGAPNKVKSGRVTKK